MAEMSNNVLILESLNTTTTTYVIERKKCCDKHFFSVSDNIGDPYRTLFKLQYILLIIRFKDTDI